MKEKKKNRFWVFLLVFTLIIYGGLYIANISGYYETSISKKTVLTSENIKKFEKDIKAGKQVDINDYKEEKKDYSNAVSNAGIKFSNGVEKFMSKGLSVTFKLLGKLFST